ncbi:MipA/OmpV family protein [Erythrobacter rubeus]|uniref:MipA/OmpV family protein n=1 Tax=Erythrobacter rubeus TaxID=2760803 RepID=A0ABR8KKQ5_9SPHN|nr:MipA/OmpV family protein [Erythrobacter rubeus]MBD2840879.1 MipA/OmpV family protein [Erythrobacter rubeus]
MSKLRLLSPATTFAACLAFAAPAAATSGTGEEKGFDLAEAESETSAQPQDRPQGQTQGSERQGPPGGFPGGKPVFDDTWATIGIGAGLVPSYSGSDNYIVFPLPLIVGRVAGVGVSPNGPGFALDFLSEAPTGAPPETTFSFGPAFRFRNDRDGNIEDPVVELTEDLETAIEVGAQGGVTFPGVFKRGDRLSLNTQVRWDILGAHNGMLVEPSVGYFTPIGGGVALQLSGNLSFVDDDFADYYYTVTPQQSADSGLPEFTADGGLNSVGALAILTVDLDGNALNGGFNIYSIAGYSRLIGDAADTPFTSIRGSANQLIGGIGVGYTF